MNNTTRKYWMHRISNERHIKQILLQKDNLLITGWHKISKDTILQEIKGKKRIEFDSIYKERCEELPRNRFCLYMFINEFKKGDYVIVPDNDCFDVYEVIGDHPLSKEYISNYIKSTEGKCLFDNRNGSFYKIGTTEELDLGFFWEVKPIELNISRKKYADNNLQRRLKFQMTNIEMTDLGDEIEKAIDNKRKGKNNNIKTAIFDSTSELIVENLKKKINDSGFEKIVRWYLECLGATSAFIPPKSALSREKGDIDVVALFDELRIAVFVQVKQYDFEVNKNAIEQVFNAYNSTYYNKYPDRTSLLWVVATCERFSDDAIDYANENNVRCICGNEFAQMLLNVGFKDLKI